MDIVPVENELDEIGKIVAVLGGILVHLVQ